MLRGTLSEFRCGPRLVAKMSRGRVSAASSPGAAFGPPLTRVAIGVPCPQPPFSSLLALRPPGVGLVERMGTKGRWGQALAPPAPPGGVPQGQKPAGTPLGGGPIIRATEGGFPGRGMSILVVLYHAPQWLGQPPSFAKCPRGQTRAGPNLYGPPRVEFVLLHWSDLAMACNATSVENA